MIAIVMDAQLIKRMVAVPVGIGLKNIHTKLRA